MFDGNRSTSSQVAVAGQVSRAPTVQDGLVGLRTDIDRAHELLNFLHEKLDPVLEAGVPSPAVNTPPIADSRLVCEQIDALRSNVQGLLRRMDGLGTRIRL